MPLGTLPILLGWFGGVPAAEWKASAGVVLPANVEGLAVRRRDAAGPAGEDASAPAAASQKLKPLGSR
jgi:hypothetical protein